MVRLVCFPLTMLVRAVGPDAGGKGNRAGARARRAYGAVGQNGVGV